MKVRIWLLLACLGLARPGAGQLAPPPGGYPFRVVETLARVPPPPGGLVPYSKGERWGFADTTGRVVIEPVLLQEPWFFTGEFSYVSLSSVPLFFSHYGSGNLPEPRKEYYTSTCVINARGEILLLDQADKRQEVPLLLPDGSLRAGRQAQHVGEPMLSYTPAPGGGTWASGTVPRPSSYRYTGWEQFRLVSNRLAWRRLHRRPLLSPRYRRRHHTTYALLRRVDTNEGFTLTDSSHHALTGAYFNHISPFRERRALVQGIRSHEGRPLPGSPPVPGPLSDNLLYLDPQGRELRLPATVTDAADFEQGTALLWTSKRAATYGPVPHTQGGIIDTLGRVLLPLTSALRGPDQYGFLRLTELVGTDSVVRFITRRATSVFASQRFRRAGPFYNGRAWVEALDGRQGLIDRTGRWVTPVPYELLGSASQRYTGRRFSPLAYQLAPPTPEANRHYELNWLPADTAYLVCRRAGKYGWVARRSGREVVPARYDSIIYHLTDGLACAVRNGQPYLLNARGQELARGEYRGDWYDYPGRPCQLFRPREGRWSVVDTSGRARLPWLPGSGFLTPDGRAVVQEPDMPNQDRLPPWGGQREYPCTGVVDSTGRVVIPFAYGVLYSGRPVSLHLASLEADHRFLYWWSDEVTPQPSQVYRLTTPRNGVQLLAARDLRPFVPGLFGGLHLLANGWHVGQRLADTVSVLIAPDGRQYVAPPGTGWSREYHHLPGENQNPPFQHGVEKVLWDNRRQRLMPAPADFFSAPRHAGYLTRCGRELWEK